MRRVGIALVLAWWFTVFYPAAQRTEVMGPFSDDNQCVAIQKWFGLVAQSRRITVAASPCWQSD